jgi:uncharacterized membrane protein YqaE (UPF0057 family)
MLEESILIFLTILCTSLPLPFNHSHPTVPPLGVFLVAGCGPDLIINICLLLCGFLAAHIHAGYVIYMYLSRRGDARFGTYHAQPVYGANGWRRKRGNASEVVGAEPAVTGVPAQIGTEVPVGEAGVLARQEYGTVR